MLTHTGFHYNNTPDSSAIEGDLNQDEYMDEAVETLRGMLQFGLT